MIEYEKIKILARKIHCKIKQHHVTVHSNGRIFIRYVAVRRYKLTESLYANVSVDNDRRIATIVLSRLGKHNRIIKVKQKAMYFYSKRISKHLSNGTRLRFIASTTDEAGNIVLCLSLVPIKDLWTLYNESNHIQK